MLKVVIDTSVWISSLLANGNSRRIREKFEGGQFQLCVAEQLLEECRGVLGRPKFSRQISPMQAARLLELIEHTAAFVQLPSPIPAVSRDPKDDPFLACAAAAECDYLVTGDEDLLVLKQHGRTRIVSPAQFLQAMQSPP